MNIIKLTADYAHSVIFLTTQGLWLTTDATVSPMEPKATKMPNDLDLSSDGMAWENMWKIVGNPGKKKASY